MKNPAIRFLPAAAALCLCAAGCSSRPRAAVVPILMYHNIGSDNTNKWWVPAAEFERQLAALRAAGYVSVAPQDLAAHSAGVRGLPPRPVMLTFDDGALNAMTEAEPLLRQYGYTGVVYLITGLVADDPGQRKSYEGTPCLTWPEVRRMLGSGNFLAGGHTRTSPDLRRTADLDYEIAGCRDDIARGIGAAPDSFCYPFGRYGPEAVEAARRAGFTTAVTCREEAAEIAHGAELLELPRIHVVGGAPHGEFLSKLGSAAPARRTGKEKQ